jgi:hypothetical protein
MVHYGHECVARTLPPNCPKCGSHRTQIVGQSADGHVIVRCSACGERSTVVDGDNPPANSHTPAVGTPDEGLQIQKVVR